MSTFNVFQQFAPTRIGEQDENEEELYAINLIPVGRVEARDFESAIREAKGWSRFGFKLGGLGRFPIVEEIQESQCLT